MNALGKLGLEGYFGMKAGMKSSHRRAPQGAADPFSVICGAPRWLKLFFTHVKTALEF